MERNTGYRVTITKRAKKAIDKNKQGRINKALRNMIMYYEGEKVLMPDIKALTGKYKGLLRLRVGNLRIIFKISPYVLLIEIIDVVMRGNAYK